MIFGYPFALMATWRAMHGIMKEMLAEEERKPGSVFDRAFIDNAPWALMLWLTNLRATAWDDIIEGSGLTRDQIRRSGSNRDAMQAHHLLLGDGIDPAQKRGRYHSGSDEFSPARRSHRPAGSGTVPGARPLQCARRSDDGDLGADERFVP